MSLLFGKTQTTLLLFEHTTCLWSFGRYRRDVKINYQDFIFLFKKF